MFYNKIKPSLSMLFYVFRELSIILVVITPINNLLCYKYMYLPIWFINSDYTYFKERQKTQ